MKKKTTFLKTLLVAVGLLMGGVNAWAKSSVWSENFESTTVEALQSTWQKGNGGKDTWGGTYASNLALYSNQNGNTSTWLCTYGSNNSRQTTAYYMFATAYTEKAYEFNAKLNMNVGNNNGANSYLYFMNGSKNGSNANPTNYLFYIGVNSSGLAYISNGTDTETSTIGNVTGTNNLSNLVMGETKNYKSTGWFDVTCIIDLEKGSVKATLSSGSKTETFSINLKDGAKQLSGIGVLSGAKTGGVVAMDDIVLYELSYPAFTLSDTSKDVAVDGSETVSVTNITGNITVSTNNESVATASYSDGAITINGVSDGAAVITVTGENDGITIEKTIDVTVGTVATTTVKVNYLSDGTPIASPLVLTDVTVGSILTANTVTYESVIYGTGSRYVNPVLSVELPYEVVGDDVINISYTKEVAVASLGVYAKIGESKYLIQNIALDGKYVNDSYNVPYPRYYNLAGTLYERLGEGKGEYHHTITLTAEGKAELDYSETDITNVVYFSEAENITGATATSAGTNMYGRSSNANCAYIAAESDDVTIVNLPAGLYKATMVCYSNSSGGSTQCFSFGETNYNADIVSKASNWETFNKTFVLNAAGNVRWLNTSNQDSRNGLDFIYIQRIAGSTVSATMGANGYATFASAYNLDLANLPDGLTAYTASLAGTALSFTEKNDAAVAAGTGLLLMGDAEQSYDIPVAATGSAVAGNALTGVITATDLQSNADGNYIFVMKKAETASDALTFLPLSTSAAVTVPAGKAYVSVPASVFASGGAKALTVSFDDVTGIESLKAEKVANGQWFNLAGQRVAQPTKGLYIQNGKKVIVK